MTTREYAYYEMTREEYEEWHQLGEQVVADVTPYIPEQTITIAQMYVTAQLYFIHYAGYHTGDCYYFVEEGQKKEEYNMVFSTPDREKMRMFLCQQILEDVGNGNEQNVRVSEKKKWKICADMEKSLPGNTVWYENTDYIYHCRYDARKFWFEYALKGLIGIFGAERCRSLIDGYEDYMNHWFEAPHWKYDIDKLEFVEISDSKELEEE